MSYWAQQAMHKRQREKQASKKTREGLIDAYRTMRAINEEKQRMANDDREGKNRFQAQEGVEGLPAADGEVGGEPLRVVRKEEDR